jgi:hypothetical protein
VYPLTRQPLGQRRTPIMVNVDIHDDDDVTITVIGIHKIWTLTSKIHFKKRNVLSVIRTEQEIRPPWLLRVGTAMPGIICAGTLFGWHRKEFWDRTKKGSGICIELANAEYTRIVVDVSGPDEIIRRLR